MNLGVLLSYFVFAAHYFVNELPSGNELRKCENGNGASTFNLAFLRGPATQVVLESRYKAFMVVLLNDHTDVIFQFPFHNHKLAQTCIALSYSHFTRLLSFAN